MQFKFVLAFLFLITVLAPAHAEEAKKVASPGVGGAFSLVDGDGKPVTEKSWPGKYKLVFFGFTNCPMICPVTLDKVAQVLDKLGDDAAKIQPLFVTTDPARDTPKVMKDYASKFHKSIVGLTGTEEQVKAAGQAYKVYAAKREVEGAPKGDYQVDHSAFIYFMSPEDEMLAIMNDKTTPEEAVAKIKEKM